MGPLEAMAAKPIQDLELSVELRALLLNLNRSLGTAATCALGGVLQALLAA